MQHKLIPAKLLIVSVDEHNTAKALDVVKKAGATGGTRVTGRNVASDRPGACESRGVVFSVITKNAGEILHSLVRASLEMPGGLDGVAMLADVPGIFLPPNRPNALEGDGQNNKEGRAMQSVATLIIGIINHGQADEIMAVARKAGARGGTIINARGTGTEDDVKFFGISLAPEKEMLLIVADDGHCQSILDAICDLPIFSEPGSGIVFTVGLEDIRQLGRQGLRSR